MRPVRQGGVKLITQAVAAVSNATLSLAPGVVVSTISGPPTLVGVVVARVGGRRGSRLHSRDRSRVNGWTGSGECSGNSCRVCGALALVRIVGYGIVARKTIAIICALPSRFTCGMILERVVPPARVGVIIAWVASSIHTRHNAHRQSAQQGLNAHSKRRQQPSSPKVAHCAADAYRYIPSNARPGPAFREKPRH